MSFYEKEKKRIIETIREPFLELVLLQLPHLQINESAREDIWELVAIKLNGMLKSKPTGNGKNFAILTGNFAKEIYDDMMKKFIKSNSLSLEQPHHFAFVPKDRVERLLFELYELRTYDIDIISKLGKEKLEDTCKEVLASQGPDSATKNILNSEKEQQYKAEIALLTDSLQQKEAQLEKLNTEVKRLLDLNHELLDGRHDH